MTRLALWRHAHATDIASDDYDRALTARGRAIAQDAGRALAAFGPFDVALVSEAVRSRETWDYAGPVLHKAVAELRLTADLYLADADGILAAAVKAEAARVIVIGHNPGLRDVCQTLSGEEVRKLRKGAFYVFDAARTGAKVAGMVDLA